MCKSGAAAGSIRKLDDIGTLDWIGLVGENAALGFALI